MALPLSTYFNWDTSLRTMNDPEMSNYYSFFLEETPPDYSDHESLFLLNNPNTFFDYSFPELTYPPQQTPSLLSDYNIFPSDDIQNLHPYPKRQKLCLEDNYYPQYHNNYFSEGLVPCNPYCSSFAAIMPEFNDEVPPLLPVPASNYCEKKMNGGGKKATVSAQSIAARERRKKISEKTQELGKIVPGGCKMNTAEMLLAASKYVKYMQAQVGMLQLMNTLKEDKASTPSDQDLQALLASPCVEEKLYLQEKCLVPEQFVTALTNHNNVRTRPSILKDLNQLIILTDTETKLLP